MLLRSLVSRWVWRQLRWVLDEREPTSSLTAGIERFSIFGGTLRITGAFAAPAPVQHLVLHLPGGERFPLAITSIGPGTVHFDQSITVVAPPTEIAVAELVATLTDGRVLRQTGLGDAIGDPAHELTNRFRDLLTEQRPGRLLEIGARARSGIVRRDWMPSGWTYSGFDIVAGPNVDTVGDAHALSRYYPPESFDAAMAFSVLEHLLMPWKFVLELNRVLKPGGFALFTTHQCWPMHDQPWDFWRFSDTAWTGLLNSATGFSIIEARLGEPAFIVPQRTSRATAFRERPSGALASFVLFRKIGPTTLTWPVELGDILQTSYPPNESTA